MTKPPLPEPQVPPIPQLTGEKRTTPKRRIIRSPPLRKQRKKVGTAFCISGICLSMIIFSNFFRLTDLLGGLSVPPTINYYLTISMFLGILISYFVGIRLLIQTKEANYWGLGIAITGVSIVCLFLITLTWFIGAICLLVAMTALAHIVESFPDKVEAGSITTKGAA